MRVYIASSYKNLHGVQLLTRILTSMGLEVIDWTNWQQVPPGLDAAERRKFMDTDEGGRVYERCKAASVGADLVVYYGQAGQDAGIEVGLAAQAGKTVWGLLGPTESPGLMLHGAVSCWFDSVDKLIKAIRAREILRRRVERAKAIRYSAWGPIILGVDWADGFLP